MFDRQRSDMLAFARVGMTVPKDHEIGRIERAKDGNPGDPAKDFAATDLTIYDSDAASPRPWPNQGDRVLVFIHGYNTGFDDGVYRLTQIAHDTRYPGTPVLSPGRRAPRPATMSTTRIAARLPATTSRRRSSCFPSRAA